MSDNIYAAPPSSLSRSAPGPAPAAAEDARFYVVSTGKATLLYLATCGMYLFYWFYKQWDTLKDNSSFESDAGRSWPFMRAIFAVFFTHALFREVKASSSRPALASWPANADATLMVLFVLVPAVIDRLDRYDMVHPMLSLAAFFMIIPTVLLLRRVQRKVNCACADEDGSSNSRLTAVNWIWLVLGGLFWVGLIGAFVGGVMSAMAEG
jgi:hypothetical protein